MKIAFAATNPCHVYELALALHSQGALEAYFSGYPRWKLKPPLADFPVHAAALRTLITYGLLKLPESVRPAAPKLFRWQDDHFDAAIAKRIRRGEAAGCHFIHGLPGQCAAIFEAAKAKGISTVLNHASGPVQQQLKMVQPEYERAGVPFHPAAQYQNAYFESEQKAWELADFHCAASSVVRDQLVDAGVLPDKIWVVGYGADAGLFPKSSAVPDGDFSICFAGQLSLRKGLFYLLQALEAAGEPSWSLNCFGPRSSETQPDFAAYKGQPQVTRQGAVSRLALGQAFQQSHVLVLPSAEEAFGLVVVQALQAGLPCIVSDRVGAKDLIRHRENGSIVPFGDPGALLTELRFWNENRKRVEETYDWNSPAAELIQISGRNV